MGLKDPGEIVSFYNIYIKIRVKHNNTTFLVAQMVKNVPAMRKTWVRSLGWEDPLEKEMATQSRTENARLKLSIQKTKNRASGPISSVQFSHSVMSNSATP